jgi:hypothetical protein
MFGVKFKDEGDKMRHGKQEDDWSCGICLPNTIAHDLFDEPLFHHKNRRLLRMQYFIKLAKAQLEMVSYIC